MYAYLFPEVAALTAKTTLTHAAAAQATAAKAVRALREPQICTCSHIRFSAALADLAASWGAPCPRFEKRSAKETSSCSSVGARHSFPWQRPRVGSRQRSRGEGSYRERRGRQGGYSEGCRYQGTSTFRLADSSWNWWDVSAFIVIACNYRCGKNNEETFARGYKLSSPVILRTGPQKFAKSCDLLKG